MECPRMHGAMDLVYLNADCNDPQCAYLCADCHGIWMRACECRAVLGVDCAHLLLHASASPVPLKCPHCQTICRFATIRPEETDPIHLHICPRCQACFFDACGFSLTFYQQIRIERAASGILGQTPLDNLGLNCCDCGAEIINPEDMHDVGIGYCCPRCVQTPPILSEIKIQNVQLVTFHGMEIKIDHWLSTTKSRIAVTPVEPCLFDVSLYSLNPMQRLMHFGHRTIRFGGDLRRHLDATEGIEHKTPWHVFIKQRGVSSCLEALLAQGEITITFKPHSIVFELNANRLGTDVRQRFESNVRRMLIAYERFVSLAHRYTQPEE